MVFLWDKNTWTCVRKILTRIILPEPVGEKWATYPAFRHLILVCFRFFTLATSLLLQPPLQHLINLPSGPLRPSSSPKWGQVLRENDLIFFVKSAFGPWGPKFDLVGEYGEGTYCLKPFPLDGDLPPHNRTWAPGSREIMLVFFGYFSVWKRPPPSSGLPPFWVGPWAQRMGGVNEEKEEKGVSTPWNHTRQKGVRFV